MMACSGFGFQRIRPGQEETVDTFVTSNRRHVQQDI